MATREGQFSKKKEMEYYSLSLAMVKQSIITWKNNNYYFLKYFLFENILK
jgi:hypothetical protein